MKRNLKSTFIFACGAIAGFCAYGMLRSGNEKKKATRKSGWKYQKAGPVSFRPYCERSLYHYDNVILGNRWDAEDILFQLEEIIINYGQASVADLYDLCGIVSRFSDNKYGWTALKDAAVVRVRHGYWLNLPRPKLL